MRAKIIFLPNGVLSGDPPRRLIDELLIFTDRAIVGRTSERAILFDGWEYVEGALRRTRAEIESWSSAELDEGLIPCQHCRSLVLDHTQALWTEEELEKKGRHHVSCDWARRRGKDLERDLPFIP